MSAMLPRRWPLWPTLFVACAVAAMIGLGVWQVRRGHEKDALVARYAAAGSLPPMAYPTMAVPTAERPLFRRATGFCLAVTDRRAVAGRNRAGESGFAILARCRAGTGGPLMTVEEGWSKDPAAGQTWTGGAVSGTIGPDRIDGMRLVSDSGLAGLAASALPDVRDIPNNHRFYSIQWWIFATLAAVIYIFALKRRERDDLARRSGGTATGTSGS